MKHHELEIYDGRDALLCVLDVNHGSGTVIRSGVASRFVFGPMEGPVSSDHEPGSLTLPSPQLRRGAVIELTEIFLSQ